MTDKPQDTISPEDADELMDAEEAWELAHEIDATVPGACSIAEAGPWYVGVVLEDGQRLTFESRDEWEEWRRVREVVRSIRWSKHSAAEGV